VYAAAKAYDLSLAHSLQYELRDTAVAVTPLSPDRPIRISFIARERITTKVGSEGKKESSPAEVAKQGVEALLDGRDHAYAAFTTTKFEGMLANVAPGSLKERCTKDGRSQTLPGS
jgi:short-subunit dehydrogenase